MAGELGRGRDSLDAKVAEYMGLHRNCAQASFRALQEGLALTCDAPAFLLP